MSFIEVETKNENEITLVEQLPASEADPAWKVLVDTHFEKLIAFFYPHLYDKIDWIRGFQSLDSELQKITRKALAGMGPTGYSV